MWTPTTCHANLPAWDSGGVRYTTAKTWWKCFADKPPVCYSVGGLSKRTALGVVQHKQDEQQEKATIYGATITATSSCSVSCACKAKSSSCKYKAMVPAVHARAPYWNYSTRAFAKLVENSAMTICLRIRHMSSALQGTNRRETRCCPRCC